MDVQRNTRERVFSILNDSNNPSFTFRQRQQSPTRSFATTKLPSISSLAGPLSPRTERPSLFRYPQFERTRSISSAGSPPLLSHDSTSSSSKSSSGSMDSTPSPITPAYNYNDNSLIPYDSLLRQDLNGAAYLPSPTGITPFMDQTQLMTPMAQDPFTQSKQLPTLIPATAYPLPVPPQQAELQPQPQPQQQMPTPALSTNNSVASIPVTSPQQATKSTHANNANNTGKKNKYPCPYATSHNCSATFTTSGHAARHGKKHTGEKGVHCPVCDKAFTRKDNMKQHERTHKNHQGSGEDRKSKAQITREANKAKAAATAAPAESDPLPELQQPARIRKSSSGISDPSESTMASTLVETPNMNDSLFPDAPQISITPDNSMPMSMPMPSGPVSYSHMAEDAMITGAVPFVDEKLDRLVPQPPALLRGFSDLDTLAQAAASDFDPYLQANTY